MKTLHTSPIRCAILLLAAALLPSMSAESPKPATPADPALPNSPAPRNQSDKLSHGDRSFLNKAAKAGMKEVDVSQAVLGRLSNTQVRDFAQSMVNDHSSANTELKALAARKGVVLDTDRSSAAEKWSKKDRDLDGDYLKEMEDDHQEAVENFEKASKSDDAEIAAFAQKTLPTLRHHLEMVKNLRKTVK